MAGILYLILLSLLARKIGILALKKGARPWLWILLMFGAWFVAGSLGYMFSMNAFGINFMEMKTMNDYLKIYPKNLVTISAISLFFAFGGYLLVQYILEQKPDITKNNGNANSIGADDLRPPSNR